MLNNLSKVGNVLLKACLFSIYCKILSMQNQWKKGYSGKGNDESAAKNRPGHFSQLKSTFWGKTHERKGDSNFGILK